MFRRLKALAIALVVAATAADAQKIAVPPLEPASKAAAILTWPAAKREQYIAALDALFLARTVKAGPHVHALDPGPPIAVFESGGARANYLEQFMNAERVRGV